MTNSLKIKAFKKTLKSLKMMVPVLIGILLLISLFQVVITEDQLMALFSENPLLNSFIGALLGSVLAGNPITSYILGGEFFNAGISIMAITAFLASWVTVGVIQLPAEIMLLGKNFALLRNFFSFLSAIFIGIFTYLILLIW